MQMETATRDRIVRNALLSVFLYASPVLLMLAVLAINGEKPWENDHSSGLNRVVADNLKLLTSYGWPLVMVMLGVIEFSLGLHEKRWNSNERKLDIVCFVVARFITRPLTAFVGLKALPILLPQLQNRFAWVPFFWGFLIICVADDLTQYWYHRLHHEIPWLWRFHRTHHSAPYMGMAMAGRQNIWYTIFFSQTYLTTALIYLGLGASAAVVLAIKQVITTMAHSSIPWDRPLYRHKALHPIAWVVERLISTPATHHAHHADINDGIGFYKGNFGNMFFLWDVIFGTGLITRQYPKSYGVSHYEGDEWYAQFLWPVFKSSVEGSELASNGPIVKDDIPLPSRYLSTQAGAD